MGIIGEILFYGAVGLGGFSLLVVIMLFVIALAAPSRYEGKQKKMEEMIASEERKEKARFEALYRRSFPDYELMTDISARTIYPATRRDDAMPVTFLFSQDGLPRLAVLLMEPYEYGEGKIRATEQACETIGLPFLRFFFSWRNDPDYVVSRTREHLS